MIPGKEALQRKNGFREADLHGRRTRALRPGRAGDGPDGPPSRIRLRRIREIACRRAREAGYDALPDFYLLGCTEGGGLPVRGFSGEASRLAAEGPRRGGGGILAAEALRHPVSG